MIAFAPRPPQSASQAVDVSNWTLHEDFAVFPVGSKPKRMLVSPTGVSEPFLISGHSYLFKTARGWQQQQVWSEVIAYRIGSMLGLPVPPCFIAVDDKTGETGALVEFFYGYPEEASPARFVHASDFMTRILVDKRRGRPHGLLINLHLCRLLCKEESIVAWWAKTLAFDALIGNTDRHPDNWGFLFRTHVNGRNQVEMAPMFDNGTSLGYEIPDEKLTEAIFADRLGRYVDKGTHHCGWERDGPSRHFDLCERLVQAEKIAGDALESVVRFELDEVESILEECTQFGVSIRFSSDRAKLVLSLLRTRKSALARLLEG
jgi:hypothetical protein